MREFCLVPKKKMDALYQSPDLVGGQRLKTVIPLTPQNKKKIKKKTVKKNSLPLPERKQAGVPDLENLIDLQFPSSTNRYAKAFLNLFKNNNFITWNEMGDLKTPIQGFNIINMLKKLISDKSNIEINELPFYKIILSSVGSPYDFIKNVNAREQLMGIMKYQLPQRPQRKRKGWSPY